MIRDGKERLKRVREDDEVASTSEKKQLPTKRLTIAVFIDHESLDNDKYRNNVENQLKRFRIGLDFDWMFVNSTQIENGMLENGEDSATVASAAVRKPFSVLFIPGGSVFVQQAALSDIAVTCICKYVCAGGGVLGICAGALLLGAEGFEGNKPERCMLGASAVYMAGKGRVAVQLTPTYGKAVFGGVLAGVDAEGRGVTISMPFSHGACFRPEHNRITQLLGTSMPLGAALPLATIVGITLESTEKSQDGEAEKAKEQEEAEEAVLLQQYSGLYPMVLNTMGRGRIIAIGPHPEAQRADSAGVMLVRAALVFLAHK